MFVTRLSLLRSVSRVIVPIIGLLGATAAAQPPNVPANRANWMLADKFTNQQLQSVVYSSTLTPRWIGQRDSLWYNWRDRNGSKFLMVVPKTRIKQPLFDHVKMATELSALHRKPYEPNNLPFTNLTFDSLGKTFTFNVDTGTLARRYEWNLAAQTLKSLGPPPRDSTAGGRGGRGAGGGRGGGQGRGGGAGANQDFRNFAPDSTAFVFARDHNLYLVEVGKPDTIQLSKDGERNYSFGFRDTVTVQQQQQQQQRDDDDQEDQQQLGGGRGGRGNQTERSRDPRVRAQVTWSPDSKAFYVQRTDSRKVKELYLVNSLSEPRPTLTSYRYAMPGESDVNQQELFAYRRGEAALAKLPIGKWKDQRIMTPHWTTGSDKLRLVRRDRLQRNLELIEVDLASQSIRTLIAESVESANIEPATANVRYTLVDTAKDTRSGDMIWWSERTGWGHFYLYDFNGNLKGPITSGPWRAEAIIDLDSAKRVAYVRGVGREEGENPYYSHLYRVNIDNGAITLLDAGNAHHGSAAASLSPSKRYLVDVSSRVDLEPSAVLRDATTGAKIMDLETMDLFRLKEIGWKPPTTFVVKAADGITDIYGNMWKPFDFDSTKKYPIIAHVYPGPQTESVTPGFSATATNQRLAQLGFVVIQIGNRGGSPQRSNAYQSYSYFNLRDYGLSDKKAGIEQLAARHPWIDITKVGIYGHSGGGFMTAAALLLPPYNDFFKVGVSSSGNHDNNVYNQNWSEQYHGLTEVIGRSGGTIAEEENGRGRAGGQGGRGGGQGGRGAGGGVGALGVRGGQAAQGGQSAQAGQSDSVTVNGADTTARVDTTFRIKVPANHELAANLKGRLLLVHGDMDNNVHPVGTIRLANALIRANKRFDLMILPGQAHGYSGVYQTYFQNMMYEYFAEHLLGDYYRGSAAIR
jgi:dipeptidyl aminopeptidase/acylaminoacyl peptidase